MGLTLAKTTFSTKADETLATVDAYLKNDSAVVNAAKDVNDTLGVNALSGLKGGDLSASLDKAVKAGTAGLPEGQGFKYSAELLLKNATGATSSLMGTLKGLPADLQNRLGSMPSLARLGTTLTGLSGGILKGDLTSIKGVVTLVKGVSSAVTGIKRLTSPGALIALGTNLVRESVAMGVKDSYSMLTEGMEDMGALGKLTKNLLPTAISSGDVNLLSNLVLGKSGPNIKSMMPSFVGDFTRQFTLPKNASIGDYATLLNNVDTGLTKVDSAWKKATLGSDVVINMNDLNACSRDMDKLLTAKASAPEAAWDWLKGTVSPATINTSAISDPLKQVAVLKQVVNTAQTPNPLNTDKEYIGLFNSIKNPNYIPPKRASGVISSAEKAAQEAAGFNSGAIIWDDAPAPAPMSVEASLKKDFPKVADTSIWHDLGQMVQGNVKGQPWTPM